FTWRSPLRTDQIRRVFTAIPPVSIRRALYAGRRSIQQGERSCDKTWPGLATKALRRRARAQGEPRLGRRDTALVATGELNPDEDLVLRASFRALGPRVPRGLGSRVARPARPRNRLRDVRQ